jgi:hypothetical protein
MSAYVPTWSRHTVWAATYAVAAAGRGCECCQFDPISCDFCADLEQCADRAMQYADEADYCAREVAL